MKDLLSLSHKKIINLSILGFILAIMALEYGTKEFALIAFLVFSAMAYVIVGKGKIRSFFGGILSIFFSIWVVATASLYAENYSEVFRYFIPFGLAAYSFHIFLTYHYNLKHRWLSAFALALVFSLIALLLSGTLDDGIVSIGITLTISILISFAYVKIKARNQKLEVQKCEKC